VASVLTGGFPQTEAEIVNDLNLIQIRIDTYITGGPAACYKLFGNTIGYSIPEYVEFLERQRKLLYKRLKNLPLWLDQDVDALGPMMKTQ